MLRIPTHALGRRGRVLSRHHLNDVVHILHLVKVADGRTPSGEKESVSQTTVQIDRWLTDLPKLSFICELDATKPVPGNKVPPVPGSLALTALKALNTLGMGTRVEMGEL